MTATAHDMSEHWRLIVAHGTGRVTGTFWATDTHITTVDVIVWDNAERNSGGAILHSKDLTAFIEPDGFKLSETTIVNDWRRDAVRDAWGDMIDALEAVASEYRRVMTGEGGAS